jgi:CheY-like chemotaxis protein
LKTLDRTDGGLGVGLSVVKRLVELHGGQVSVASSPKGTTFTISLSAESLNPAITLNGDPAGPVNETVTESLRGLHLLLAEDQRDAADILAQLLRAEGLQVDVAYDGQQCLDMAQRNRPDAILMDIGMPKLDGWTVARNLRSNPRFSAVVMVAMSGYGQQRGWVRLALDQARGCHRTIELLGFGKSTCWADATTRHAGRRALLSIFRFRRVSFKSLCFCKLTR